MRHIQIKILTVIVTILLSVSSYGQMQQVLKNGFVAATNSGVYYLQDGFDEWVQIAEGRSVVINIDPSNNVPVYVPTTSDIQYYIYGKKLRSDKVGGGSDSTTLLDLNLDLHHGAADYGYRGGSGWISAYGTRDGVSYGFTMSRRDGITDLSTDNDTIVCFVGNNNQLIKYTLAKNETIINISGLHSRSTDSHQICYNPDDDEFIIVSDSGIVYSYDKTTVTTLDTIKTSVLPTGSTITDLEWWGGSAIFIGYKNNTGNGVSFYSLGQQGQFYTSSSTSDVFISKSNLKYIQANNNIFMAILSYDNVKIFTPNTINGEINKNADNLPIGRTVFDLDYINYMP